MSAFRGESGTARSTPTALSKASWSPRTVGELASAAAADSEESIAAACEIDECGVRRLRAKLEADNLCSGGRNKGTELPGSVGRDEERRDTFPSPSRGVPRHPVNT